MFTTCTLSHARLIRIQCNSTISMWLQLICDPLSSECLQPLTWSIYEPQREMRGLSCIQENHQDLPGERTDSHRQQLGRPVGRRVLKGRNATQIDGWFGRSQSNHPYLPPKRWWMQLWKTSSQNGTQYQDYDGPSGPYPHWLWQYTLFFPVQR